MQEYPGDPMPNRLRSIYRHRRLRPQPHRQRRLCRILFGLRPHAIHHMIERFRISRQ